MTTATAPQSVSRKSAEALRLQRKLARRYVKTDMTPKDQRFCLRVKVKSLMAEARIIRKEENRTCSYAQFYSLRLHRLGLRSAMRESQLALAFIRGLDYHQVESEGSKEIGRSGIANIAIMVKRYGADKTITPDDIEGWVVAGPGK